MEAVVDGKSLDGQDLRTVEVGKPGNAGPFHLTVYEHRAASALADAAAVLGAHQTELLAQVGDELIAAAGLDLVAFSVDGEGNRGAHVADSGR
jgi:hypothetical protein